MIAKDSMGRIIKRKKPKPSVRNRTEDLMKIKDIQDGIILTRDKRFIKIVEIKPTNFFYKNALEQARMVYQFSAYLRTAPEKLQIQVINIPLDVSDYVEYLISQKDLPTANERTKEIAIQLATLVKAIRHSHDLKVNRYFVVYVYDDYAQGKLDFNVIKETLNEQEYTLAETMKKCGCEVYNYHLLDVDDHGNQISVYDNYAVYEAVITQFERQCPDFETYAREVFEEITTKNFRKANSITIEDYLSPKEVSFYSGDFCEVNGQYVSYHYIKDYRPEVFAGWLNFLTSSEYGPDINIYFEQMDSLEAKKTVRKSVTRQEIVLENLSHNTSMAQESKQIYYDAVAMRERMYKRGEQLYMMTIIVTLSAKTLSDLAYKEQRVYELCERNDMPLAPLKDRQDIGFHTCLPFCYTDKRLNKFIARNIMSGDVASIFPFNNPSIFDDGGIFIGLNSAGHLCAINPWDTSKYPAGHMMIIGSTGMGKTYAIQNIMSRSRTKGVRVFGIAPIKGHEYERMTRMIGGEFIQYTTSGNVHINIFDIVIPEVNMDADGNENKSASFLATKMTSVMRFFRTLMPFLTPTQLSLLDTAVILSYKIKGITMDNESVLDSDGNYKEVPIIGDVMDTLLYMTKKEYIEEKEGYEELRTHNKGDIFDLMNYLNPFVYGSYSFLNHQTNIDINNQYVVFDISEMDSCGENIVSAVMFSITDYIMGIMSQDIQQMKLVVIDEAWKLIGDGSGESAEFIKKLYKVIRAYNGVVITGSQDLDDWQCKDNESVLRTIVNNSTFQILLGMKPLSLKMVGDVMNLSPDDKARIASFVRGDALLACSAGTTGLGISTFGIRFTATDSEHECITTDPQELKKIEDRRKGILAITKRDHSNIDELIADSDLETILGQMDTNFGILG